MDYEKEYNEMVRRCKELHESGNALTKQQMEIVCPQLAESEDERIRKGLLRHFKNKTKPYWNEIAVKDIIAYLERQKDIEKRWLEDRDGCFWDGVQEGKKAAQEQKPIPIEDEKDFLEKEVKAFLCNYDKEFDDDAPAYDIAEHFYQLGKNSQKPAKDKDAIEPTPKQDYSGLTGFERAIHRGFLCAGVENVPVGIIKDTAQDCLAHIKSAEWSEDIIRKAVKEVGLTQHQINWFKNNIFPTKQEWSEEDELKRNNLIGLVEEIKGQPLKRLEDWDGYINWLKSLHPQPKQEWSEADKQMLKNIIEVIGEACPGNYTASFITKMLSWLKSLRPQPHWKPSEELMEALDCAIGIMRYMREGDTLRELYANLKKL